MIPTDNEPTELQKAVFQAEVVLDIASEFAFRSGEVMYDTLRELLSAAKQISALQAEIEELKLKVHVFGIGATNYALVEQEREALQVLSDLHRDEFKRIRAIATDTEIQGLCDRAVTQIEQHVPLIVQRDSAVRQAFDLQAENELLKAN